MPELFDATFFRPRQVEEPTGLYWMTPVDPPHGTFLPYDVPNWSARVLTVTLLPDRDVEMRPHEPTLTVVFGAFWV